MYNVVAILPSALADGLALSGVAVVHADTPTDTEDAIQDAIDSGEYGIVIVAEEMMASIDERTAERFHDQRVPLLVSIPAELKWKDVEEKPTDSYAANLIRRAIGYQLNIRL